MSYMFIEINIQKYFSFRETTKLKHWFKIGTKSACHFSTKQWDLRGSPLMLVVFEIFNKTCARILVGDKCYLNSHSWI
jgi:hypothetical protein